MEKENRREWRVNKPKLENILEDMQYNKLGNSIVSPAKDKKPKIERLDRGYGFNIPVQAVFIDSSFAKNMIDESNFFPRVYGRIAPNNSRSSWYIVDAGIYVPGEEFHSELMNNNDHNKVLYSTDRLFGIIEDLGKNVGARGVTTEIIPDEHHFKKNSLEHLGYRIDHTGGYFKRI